MGHATEEQREEKEEEEDEEEEDCKFDVGRLLQQ